jgi:hypothetical protein
MAPPSHTTRIIENVSGAWPCRLVTQRHNAAPTPSLFSEQSGLGGELPVNLSGCTTSDSMTGKPDDVYGRAPPPYGTGISVRMGRAHFRASGAASCVASALSMKRSSPHPERSTPSSISAPVSTAANDGTVHPRVARLAHDLFHHIGLRANLPASVRAPHLKIAPMFSCCPTKSPSQE